MFKLEPSKYPNEMPGIRWQGEALCASQFGDSEFMAACEGIGRFSRQSLLKILTAYIDNKVFMQGNRRSGEPNWHHPTGVALVGLLEFGNTTTDSVIADLMHDVKEDSPLFQGHKSLVGEFETFSPFDMLAGRYNKRVAKIVMAVSKPPPPIPKKEMDEAMRERYLRFVFNRVVNLYPEVRHLATQTKIRDRIFNLRTEGNSEKLAKKTFETIRYILPMAEYAGEQYEEVLREVVDEHRHTMTPQQKAKAIPQKFNIEI